ncbi:MAG: hypothetical protein JOZ47_07045 [Kutzneria sp.]|nr:hypothetical protein [Kutzneria sp.]
MPARPYGLAAGDTVNDGRDDGLRAHGVGAPTPWTVGTGAGCAAVGDRYPGARRPSMTIWCEVPWTYPHRG